MTGKQQTVMWMGLTLVMANLFFSPMWKTLWNGTILQGAVKNLSSGTAPPNPLGNPGGGGAPWFPYMNTTAPTKPTQNAKALSV